MVGPFGGTTAAQMLAAVLQHPHRIGDPVSLTVNFAAAVDAVPFRILADPVRTNRSTQHWMLRMLQTNSDGEEAVVTTATAITAKRRDTWQGDELPMPEVPPAADLTRDSLEGRPTWFGRYDVRYASGHLTLGTEPQPSSMTQVWVRDEPRRPLDHCGLAARCDVFFPRVWLRAGLMPAGTVSITTYFHVDQAGLDAVGHGFVLGQARGQRFFNQYFDQSVALWSEAGTVLATSHQVVYFKG